MLDEWHVNWYALISSHPKGLHETSVASFFKWTIFIKKIWLGDTFHEDSNPQTCSCIHGKVDGKYHDTSTFVSWHGNVNFYIRTWSTCTTFFTFPPPPQPPPSIRLSSNLSHYTNGSFTHPICKHNIKISGSWVFYGPLQIYVLINHVTKLP